MKKLSQTLNTLGIALSCWLLSLHPALAALPTTTAPTTNTTASNFLDNFKFYARDAGLLAGLLLALAALIWIGYHILQDLHEVRTGRKEMGQLALSVVAGGVALLMVIYLANQASTIIT